MVLRVQFHIRRTVFEIEAHSLAEYGVEPPFLFDPDQADGIIKRRVAKTRKSRPEVIGRYGKLLGDGGG